VHGPLSVKQKPYRANLNWARKPGTRVRSSWYTTGPDSAVELYCKVNKRCTVFCSLCEVKSVQLCNLRRWKSDGLIC